jgi:hypothetical protein
VVLAAGWLTVLGYRRVRRAARVERLQ